jgi:predicted phage terminase large subunit-like protein
MSAPSSVLSELLGSFQDRAADGERAARAKTDFAFFCRRYLADYFYDPPAEYQTPLYDVANSQSLSDETAARLAPFVAEKYRPLFRPAKRLAGVMFVEPREHGKTVRWSFAYPLWLLLTGRKKYILLIGASDAAAAENLGNIKLELEENERLIEDFGDQKGALWRTNRLELACGSCVQSKGSGMSMRGTRFRQYRPDFIVLDDILKDEAADSPAQRDKIYRRLKRAVFNLGKSAFIVWVNTIFHNDDPISRLMKETAAGTLKRCAAVRLSCFCPDGMPLWAEHWSAERLEEKRSQLGSAIFSTEFLNEPISSEDAVIKTFHYYALKDAPFEDRKRYGGIDPATGVHDKCAFCTLVDGDDGVLYVGDSWGERLAETPFLEKIIATFAVWKHCSIGFEDVAFQGIYKDNLMEKAAARKVWLPISGRKTGGLSKQERVREMAPLIEAGFIRFREDQKELVEQLAIFTPDGPKSAYDDEADALWYAFKEAQRRKADGAPVIAASRIITRLAHSASSVIARARGRG